MFSLDAGLLFWDGRWLGCLLNTPLPVYLLPWQAWKRRKHRSRALLAPDMCVAQEMTWKSFLLRSISFEYEDKARIALQLYFLGQIFVKYMSVCGFTQLEIIYCLISAAMCFEWREERCIVIIQPFHYPSIPSSAPYPLPSWHISFSLKNWPVREKK